MTKRHIAHIEIEAATPLKIGSAKSDFFQDSPIQKDWNGLPMILGTSIAGVLRHALPIDLAQNIFAEEEGSRVIVSNALLLDRDGTVHEAPLLEKNDFLNLFEVLPIREHTAITEKGIARAQGKFDEEVLYKGSRFKFRLEMLEEDTAQWETLLKHLHLPSFRLGGGGTKGFGKLKIRSITHAVYTHLDEAYINLSSSLNETFGTPFSQSMKDNTYRTYTLTLQADNFFMFGSGFGDDTVDEIPVYEYVIDYKKKGLRAEKVLIPASSIKGAIAHRTTYHFNKINKLFIGDKDARNTIPELFGEKAGNNNDGFKGKVLFSDVYLDKTSQEVFQHVKIDRFTSGSMESALFNEKTLSTPDVLKMKVLVDRGVEKVYIDAFERTLEDICSGMLPLGGGVNKGHGIFSGEWSSDDK